MLSGKETDTFWNILLSMTVLKFWKLGYLFNLTSTAEKFQRMFFSIKIIRPQKDLYVTKIRQGKGDKMLFGLNLLNTFVATVAGTEIFWAEASSFNLCLIYLKDM